MPDEIPEFKIDNNNSEIDIVNLITTINFAPSRAEAKRLIMQGGVSVDGEKVSDFNYKLKLIDGMILKVGKRKFVKFVK